MRVPLRPLVALCAAISLLTPGALTAQVTILEDHSPAKLTSIGNEYLLQRRYEVAKEQYQKALAKDPLYFYALFNLALVHQQMDEFAEARAAYEQAAKADPENPQVLCNLAWLDFRRNDWTAAADRFARAASMSSSRPREQADFTFNLGAVRERQGRHDEARKMYERALELDPHHYGAHFNLGTLWLERLNDHSSSLTLAADHLSAATRLQPDRMEAWLNLAICRERQGLESAGVAYDRAVDVATPAQVARARWQRALYHDRQRPPRKLAMRDDLRAVLAAEPGFPDANGRLGAYHYSIGEFEQSAALLEREVAGSDPAALTQVELESHYLLAEIYSRHRPDAGKARLHAAICVQARPQSDKIQEAYRRIAGSGAE